MGKIYCVVHMDVKPGITDFRERALACVEAAKADLAGTVAYEWFLAEDGRSCTVIEIYDDADAIATHSRHVGAAVSHVKEAADFSLQFAGDVPDAILTRMRERLGAVSMIGPRFQGRLNEAAVGRVGPNAPAMIFAVARFSIHPGKQAEFRTLAAECFATVASREPNTLGYEWFMNEEGAECLTIDVYRDAAALAAHMANVGPIMSRILAIVDSQTSVYGAVPENLRAKFKPGLAAQYVAPQVGGVM